MYDMAWFPYILNHSFHGYILNTYNINIFFHVYFGFLKIYQNNATTTTGRFERGGACGLPLLRRYTSHLQTKELLWMSFLGTGIDHGKMRFFGDERILSGKLT